VARRRNWWQAKPDANVAHDGDCLEYRVFSRNPQSKKPQEFFPHLEEYFIPPSNMTRQERDFLAFTSLPGFRKEFLDILGGNNGR
jgi:hypothetical protein